MTCAVSGDNALSFAEFNSFLRVLKHQDLGSEIELQSGGGGLGLRVQDLGLGAVFRD